MIGGIVEHTGGPRLAAHLANIEDNETVDVRVFGLVASDIHGGIPELLNLTVGARTRRPLIHAWASPARHLTEDQWDSYWARFETEFGIEGFPYVEVIQEKLGHGRTATHRHRVYPRVRPNRRLVRLSHARPRQEKLSRVTEHLLGEPLVRGRHNRAVAAALRAEGRADIADAMERAGLLDGLRPVAPSPEERAMTERRESLSADAVWERAYDAWRRTSTAEDLARELSDVGLVLAMGDRKPVLVAPGGVVHDLRRAVSNGARRAGGDGVRAADIARRLADFPLPSLEEAKTQAPTPRPGPATRTGITRSEPVAPSQAPEPDAPDAPLAEYARRDEALPRRLSWRECAQEPPAPEAILVLTADQERARNEFLDSLCGGAAAEVIASRPKTREAEPRTVGERRAERPSASTIQAEPSAKSAPGMIARAGWRDRYKAELANLPQDLGHLVRWVERIDAAHRVIRLKSGTSIATTPDIAVADRCTSDTVPVMVGYAKTRGWSEVEITGGTAAWRAAMAAAARAAGMRVVAPRPPKILRHAVPEREEEAARAPPGR